MTLSPDYPLLASRVDMTPPAQLGWGSGTIKGVWDHMRAIDLLLALPDLQGAGVSLPRIDAGRIGAIGCSLGGHNSLFLAAFDERVALAVTSCGFDSFKHCESSHPSFLKICCFGRGHFRRLQSYWPIGCR